MDDFCWLTSQCCSNQTKNNSQTQQCVWPYCLFLSFFAHLLRIAINFLARSIVLKSKLSESLNNIYSIKSSASHQWKHTKCKQTHTHTHFNSHIFHFTFFNVSLRPVSAVVDAFFQFRMLFANFCFFFHWIFLSLDAIVVVVFVCCFSYFVVFVVNLQHLFNLLIICLSHGI